MKRLLLAPIVLVFFAQFVTAQSAREILRLGRGTANALDWRPDGAVLAVGGSLGIWLYDADFAPLGQIEEAGQVYHLEWSPHGEQLAFSRIFGEIEIWRIDSDGSSGELIETISPAGDIFSWSPDGEHLAANNPDVSGVSIWDTISGERLTTIPDALAFVTWSPDSSKLAGGSESHGGVQVWDTATGEALQSFEAIEDDLYFGVVAWSPNGEMLAAASSLPTSLHVWNPDNGELVNEAMIGSDVAAISQLAWSPDGNALVEIGGLVESARFTSVTVYDAMTWQPMAATGYPNGMAEAIWTPDGKHITMIDYGGTIRNWNPEKDEFTEYDLYTSQVSAVAWSPDGRRLASAGDANLDDTTVMIWDVAATESSTIDDPSVRFHGRNVSSLRWAANGSEVLASGWNSAAIHNASTGQRNDLLFEHFEFDVPPPVVDWTADFNRVAYSLWGGNKVEVREELDWTLGEPLMSLVVSEVEVTEIAWSPDEGHIATVSVDSERDSSLLEVWDVSNSELTMSSETDAWVRQVLWSPDGHKLALVMYISDAGFALETINPATGDSLSIIQAITPEANWHPDSQMLAIVVEEEVHLWDAITGETLGVLPVEGVTALDWSPDATRLALGMSDGTIRIWDVSDLTQPTS